MVKSVTYIPENTVHVHWRCVCALWGEDNEYSLKGVNTLMWCTLWMHRERWIWCALRRSIYMYMDVFQKYIYITRVDYTMYTWVPVHACTIVCAVQCEGWYGRFTLSWAEGKGQCVKMSTCCRQIAPTPILNVWQTHAAWDSHTIKLMFHFIIAFVPLSRLLPFIHFTIQHYWFFSHIRARCQFTEIKAVVASIQTIA